LLKNKSLFKELITWFILLSLIPVSLISWFNYDQAKSSLQISSQQKLNQSSYFKKNIFQIGLNIGSQMYKINPNQKPA
jgi:hypothetical protein